MNTLGEGRGATEGPRRGQLGANSGQSKGQRWKWQQARQVGAFSFVAERVDLSLIMHCDWIAQNATNILPSSSVEWGGQMNT